MSNGMQILMRALRNTAGWVFFIFAAVTIIAIVIGPFILAVWLDTPAWTAALTIIWAVLSFIFALALLHELEEL